jgi:hypothetical protein
MLKREFPFGSLVSLVLFPKSEQSPFNNKVFDLMGVFDSGCISMGMHKAV